MDFFKWLFRLFAPSKHNDHHPHLLRRGWLLFFLTTVLATEGFLVADLVARQSSDTFLAAVVPAEVVAMTNADRQQQGVGALTTDDVLTKAAQAKAEDMAAKGYFSHVGPDGKTPWQWISAAGYQYQYAGENLGVRFINSQDVVNAWMASPTHRSNLLRAVYTDIGVGVAQGLYEGQPATYIVQFFGAPTPSYAAQQIKPTVASANPSGAAAATASNATQSIGRQILRALADPQTSANVLLGLVASILIAALCASLVLQPQIQHKHMLMTASFVALVTLGLLALNFHLESPLTSPQAASVGYALLPAAP